MSVERIDGVVLAGGYSSRMLQGDMPCDKAWLRLAGIPLIEHVARSLGSQVDTLYISSPNLELGLGRCGTGSPDGPSTRSGLPVEGSDASEGSGPGELILARAIPVQDATSDRRGPLAGVLAAMLVSQATWLAVAPCDVPFLPDGWVSRLHAAAVAAGRPAALATQHGARQPVCMIVRCDLRAGLQEALDAGTRKVGQWQRDVGAIEVAFDDAPPDAFLNINTPDELAQAQGIAARAQLSQRANS